MRKLILIFLALLMWCGTAFAGSIITTDVESNGVTTIPVATTSTVYTKAYDISDSQYFSVSYWTYASTGTSSVTIQVEQSTVRPTAEYTTNANYTVPVSMADITTSLTTESTWYTKAFSPISQRYVRFKITGTGSNDATNVVQLKFSRKQD